MKKSPVSSVLVLGLILGAVASIFGCGRVPSPAESSASRAESKAVVFTDDTGHEIRFDSTPVRVVALAPSLAEIVCDIGRESSLVGVSSYSDRPPSLLNLPIAGSYVRPNIEQVLALRPDLVLFVAEGPPRESIERLRELGLRVVVLKTNGFADIVRNVRRLGEILDARENATRLTTDMERRYAQVKAAVAGLPRPRTLYCIAIDPVITAGQSSFLHELIGDAGGENIAGDQTVPYPRLSLEAILAREPEVIVFDEGMGSLAGGDVARTFWRRWPLLPAVKSDRLMIINRDSLNRPSARIVEGLASLAAAIHPERRAEIEDALEGSIP